MKRWGRGLASAAVGLCALSLTVFGVSGLPTAQAEAPLTLDQAKAQLADLKAQNDALETQLDQSVDIMNQALVEQASLETDIANQQVAIDAMAPAFAEMVNAQRQSRPWADSVRFLFNDDPAQFITHISVTAIVQETLGEQMARLGNEKQRLTETKDALDATIKQVQDETKVQQALLEQQEAAEAQAQALVNRLTASQRASLGAVTTRGVKPQTAHLVQVITSLFPQITSVGTLRAGNNGDHGHGLAADFMIPDYKNNVALGWQIAHYVMDHAAELGVKYIIWQQSIWQTDSPGRGWRHMADRGSDNENHKNHVHVSLYA